MNRRMAVKAFLVLTVLAIATSSFATPPPLIPREVLFGNPVKASPQISPDGTHLAYLAPSDKGVLNVWVRTIGKEDDIQVSGDTYRGIRNFFWTEDSGRLLYRQDQGGDENFHVFLVDLASKVVRDLTPFQGIRAQGVMTDRTHPNELLVGLNLRDRRVFDMHRVDLTTGAITLDTQNPGDVVAWLADSSFVIRGAAAQNAHDASTVLRVRDSRDGAWREIARWPFGENGQAYDFTADGKGLIVATSLGSDTSRLILMDATSGKEVSVLASNRKADVGEVEIHPDSHTVQAVGFNVLKNEWTVLDESIKADFAFLATVRRGQFYLTSRNRADTSWIVVYQGDSGPVAWYAYDRASRKAALLFVNQPELAKVQLANMEPVVITSRDGLDLVSYLTLPAGVEGRNLPLILFPHGGPWARDNWGYNPTTQWLANRGYAVLQVNFRGSTGFGKAFLNAGNGQWGVGAMQHDLTDAVKWAISKGIADPKRVCIMGGSYGGYATLAGLTFTPELYACGVDIVGPSNIRTLFGSIPPYWAPIKAQFVQRVGDVEKDEELNRRISPLFFVDRIKVPLLIGQGANDPRVNIRESDQIVAAMRAKKLPVTYVVYPDEGHGFGRPVNRMDFNGRAEEFLATHLGGRAEPWKEVKGATGELR